MVRTKSKKNKPENKRRQTPYPGLVRGVNPKTRWEYMDQDYIHKLSAAEKQWLSNFNEEDMSGNFQHKGETLYKTQEQRRECYARNNARNRDVMSIFKPAGKLKFPNNMTDAIESAQKVYDAEEVLVTLLDLKFKYPGKKS